MKYDEPGVVTIFVVTMTTAMISWLAWCLTVATLAARRRPSTKRSVRPVPSPDRRRVGTGGVVTITLATPSPPSMGSWPDVTWVERPFRRHRHRQVCSAIGCYPWYGRLLSLPVTGRGTARAVRGRGTEEGSW